LARLAVQSIRVFSVLEGQDDTGLLVTFEQRLAAVLVKLGAIHGDQEGCWHLEVGFGLCAGRPATFRSVAEALRWIGERCLDGGDELESEIIELGRSG
jgi:hypothetical protein